MNISLLSTLWAHSPSCCFPHHLKLEKDYYKWRLHVKITPNSVPRSIRTVPPSSARKKILTTKHRNLGREDLTELSTSLTVQGSRKDELQIQPGKHHSHKQLLFIAAAQQANKDIQLNNIYTQFQGHRFHRITRSKMRKCPGSLTSYWVGFFSPPAPKKVTFTASGLFTT